MELTGEERDLLLAALFELWITRSAFDEDPDREFIPIAKITSEKIEALVVKLGGDPDTALFGAYRHSLEDGPVPEYPADDTDEG